MSKIKDIHIVDNIHPDYSGRTRKIEDKLNELIIVVNLLLERGGLIRSEEMDCVPVDNAPSENELWSEINRLKNVNRKLEEKIGKQEGYIYTLEDILTTVFNIIQQMDETYMKDHSAVSDKIVDSFYKLDRERETYKLEKENR